VHPFYQNAVMDLIEREGYLHSLKHIFKEVLHEKGRCVFICGESGIGKTALVAAFKKEIENACYIYEGVCDSLYTPRPLAPLYDIAWQIGYRLIHTAADMHDRAALFSDFLDEVSKQQKACVIVFEDVHWADEATLDFIKFMARRITHLRCMFILTYRDNEVHTNHPLVNIFGQISPQTYTRFQLPPLSLNAVTNLAQEKGFDGKEVYRVSGGNPFYVNEILASYSENVPETVRDGILSAYNRTGERTRAVWDLLSVIPDKFNVEYLKQFNPDYLEAIDNCLRFQILIQRDGKIFFKHELFRRTIENSLSPIKRLVLNKSILDLFLTCFEDNQEIEKIVHHAKNANEYDTVVKYAPLAARQAASVGAHAQAGKLLLTAIEFYQGDDAETLISLYQAYAYECYLTSNIKHAIVFASRTQKLLKKSDDIEASAECLRFLSHLWSLEGDVKIALRFANEAIDCLPHNCSPITQLKAYNNMSELTLLSDEPEESLTWAEKALTIARQSNNEEGRCHALNMMGTINMMSPDSYTKGFGWLKECLRIALDNQFDEHAAKAYANMAKSAVMMRKYEDVEQLIEEGLRYTEERSLELWRLSILLSNGRLNLAKNNWSDALEIAALLVNSNVEGPVRVGAEFLSAVVKLRMGVEGSIDPFVKAKEYAKTNSDRHSFIVSINGLLEYEWLTGSHVLAQKDVDDAVDILRCRPLHFEQSEFFFWLMKTGRAEWGDKFEYAAVEVNTHTKAGSTATKWLQTGNRYLQAHALFHGSDEDKRMAVGILLEIGAEGPAKKLKQEMRAAGIKGIPRGLRYNTKSNAALLTDREMNILFLLKNGLQNKEIAGRLFISPKTVDHHISSILFKLDVNSRVKAVTEALRRNLIT
jgi:DNA-binding CsgD family transcriptional regulator